MSFIFLFQPTGKIVGYSISSKLFMKDLLLN